MSETPTYVRSPLFSARRPLSEIEHAAGPDLVGYLLTLAVGTGIFLAALDHATFSEVSRNSLAVGVWWAVVLAVAIGVQPVMRIPPVAFATGGLLLAFAVWTLASTQWTTSAEDAFDEANRVVLYVGLFALVVVLSRPGSAGRWLDGLALGITATGLLALTSRLFPDVISTNDFKTVLTSAYARLSYPLGYWNGLAIFCGIAFPLLLRAALESRYALLRGLALAPVPALAGVVYLASSRGGSAVLVLGTLCFLLLTPNRWSAIAATSLAAIAGVGVVALLASRDQLVNHPGTPAAQSQGHRAAILIAAICVLEGAIWAAGTILLEGRLPESATLERVAVGLVILVAVVGIAASRPVHRVEQFKAPPEAASSTNVSNHLLSNNGSGRWQLWTAAIDEFRSEPLHGRGAGSFGAWWLQSRHYAGFARDAHSLYAETLGELGIIGLLLLAGAMLTAAVSGLVRSVARIEAAPAALASFLGFAAGSAVDWMWELTVVTIVGVVLMAVMTGPATRPLRRYVRAPEPRRRLGLAVGLTVIVLALLAVGTEGLGLVTRLHIQDSQSAAARGNLVAAANDAVSAKSLEPWASTPYLQLALVNEQAGQLPEASRWIGQAIDRDRNDWRLWLTQTRIQVERGQAAAAVRSARHACTLNPSSSLLSCNTAG